MSAKVSPRRPSRTSETSSLRSCRPPCLLTIQTNPIQVRTHQPAFTNEREQSVVLSDSIERRNTSLMEGCDPEQFIVPSGLQTSSDVASPVAIPAETNSPLAIIQGRFVSQHSTNPPATWPSRRHVRPSTINCRARARLTSDQLLFGRRGVNRMAVSSSSTRRPLTSIHPKHNATSISAGRSTEKLGEDFL